MNKKFVSMEEYIVKLKLFVYRNKALILLFLLLILLIFLRFYQLDARSHFSWDEVNNAWAAKNIIVEHKFPLVGFQAKLNSGIYIGPIYYYLISVFYLFPLFMSLFICKNISREKLLFCYLIFLWFIVPWLVLSTYSGEISDYYFSTNRFIALLIIAYLLSRIFELKVIFAKAAVAGFLIFYMVFNINKFLLSTDSALRDSRLKVLQAIKEGREIGFYEGSPDSYLYYYYMRKEGKKVY